MGLMLIIMDGRKKINWRMEIGNQVKKKFIPQQIRRML